MKIKGRLSISRITSNEPRGGWIRITLEDGSSSVQFAEVDIDFKQFGQAISGMSGQLCDIELRQLDLVGKKMEHKFELVPVPITLDKKDKKLIKLIETIFAPYEIDGWVARRDDIFNYHNYRGSHSSLNDYDSYEVSFTRYI